MFASAQMIERSQRISLDAHRCIEVVETQGDGQPYAHFRKFVVAVQVVV